MRTHSPSSTMSQLHGFSHCAFIRSESTRLTAPAYTVHDRLPLHTFHLLMHVNMDSAGIWTGVPVLGDYVRTCQSHVHIQQSQPSSYTQSLYPQAPEHLALFWTWSAFLTSQAYETIHGIPYCSIAEPVDLCSQTLPSPEKLITKGAHERNSAEYRSCAPSTNPSLTIIMHGAPSPTHSLAISMQERLVWRRSLRR